MMFSEIMEPMSFVLALLFLCAAALYASVGHGGASAYLAVMSVAGLAPMFMKPVALVLNIAVSMLALIFFVRSGHFNTRLFWPLAAGSVPAAWVGGSLHAPDTILKWIIAAALIAGAARLLWIDKNAVAGKKASLMVLFALGAGIGLLSGLAGIGGGIFLTPVLVLAGWSSPKSAAAVSAAFIAVNSCAGICGFMTTGGTVPPLVWFLLPWVIAGACIGSYWGSCKAPSAALRRALAAVLAVAAVKFVLI